MQSLSTRFIVTLLFSCLAYNGFTQTEAISDDSLANKFYSLNHHQIYWLSSAKNAKRAGEWLKMIDSAEEWGMVSDKTQTDKLRTSLDQRSRLSDFDKEIADRQITGLVLKYLKNLHQGEVNFAYDELSVSRDTLYINQLLNSRSRGDVSKIVSQFDCKDPDYLVLKKYLNDSITAGDTLKYKSVKLAMNYRRYLTFNQHPEYIMVNIPSAEAVYYQNGLPAIKMRTVVGKKSSPTPLLSTYISGIVTFPYWNVPYSIASKEILPKVQKNGNYLEQNNYDVVDAKGNVIEESELNWNDYDASNFPYFFRQSTGLENALGVLKFNLDNPYSIFLHSTSNQSSFSKDVRFLSHGCVRLEKPLELADALLRGKIDLEELKEGKSNTLPKTIPLPDKIPAYIIYMPVRVEGGRVSFLKDVYGLL